jgi:hypothetical protein
MTRISTIWTTVAALFLAGDDPPSEKTEAPYDSKTQGALMVKDDTGDWFIIS